MLHLRCCVALLLAWVAPVAGSATCDAGSSLEGLQEIKRTEDRAMVLLQITGSTSQLSADSLHRISANASEKSSSESTATVASEWQQRLHAAQKRKQRLLEDRETIADEKKRLKDLQTSAADVQEVPIEEANSAWTALAKKKSSKKEALQLEEASEDLQEDDDAESGPEEMEFIDDGYEEDESSEEADDSGKDSRRELSLAEAASESLNEQGYESVAAAQDGRRMELFIRRLIMDLGLRVVDEGGLKGFIPYYSGQKDTQSFAALREELLSSATPGGWVQFTSGGWRQFTSSVRQKEHILIETGVTRNEAVKISSSSSGKATMGSKALSFLARIPQMTYDLFGYTTTAVICGSVLAAMLCLIDERKRTTKDLNSFLEPPLLDASPEPPKMFDNPLMNQKLEDLRFGKR